MALTLTHEERSIAAGEQGEGAAMAMRIVAETAKLMGAPRLIPVASAHIDGALYHGDSGTLFAEKLVEGGAKVKVRSTLNVGSIDLTGCSHNLLPAHEADMAKRMMRAYIKLGCEPTGPALRIKRDTGQQRAQMSHGVNPMQSCSAIRFWVRVPIVMAISSILPVRLLAARPIMVCIAAKTVALRW